MRGAGRVRGARLGAPGFSPRLGSPPRASIASSAQRLLARERVRVRVRVRVRDRVRARVRLGLGRPACAAREEARREAAAQLRREGALLRGRRAELAVP